MQNKVTHYAGAGVSLINFHLKPLITVLTYRNFILNRKYLI
jgi:hypothetical protein